MSEIIIKNGNRKIVQTADKIIITVEDDTDIDLTKAESIQYENAESTDVPLLSITVQDINSVPIVLYKGQKIDYKTVIDYKWTTAEADHNGQHSFNIEHYSREEKCFNKIGKTKMN